MKKRLVRLLILAALLTILLLSLFLYFFAGLWVQEHLYVLLEAGLVSLLLGLPILLLIDPVPFQKLTVKLPKED